MTAEIASCLNGVLKPFEVAVVVIEAAWCMTTRGVHKSSVTMVTSQMLKLFRKRVGLRQEFPQYCHPAARRDPALIPTWLLPAASKAMPSSPWTA